MYKPASREERLNTINDIKQTPKIVSYKIENADYLQFT